jgi:tetratricopeptide (TPR) repeat protein
MTAAAHILRGRQALMTGKAELAIEHFSQALNLSPEILHFFTLPQSAATYLGRAYYEARQLAQARAMLERGCFRFEEDHMAELYLGLTLLRSGAITAGVEKVDAGARGLHQWIEYREANNIGQGAYWDPLREIRNAIDALRQLLRGTNVDVEKVIASGEWLGNRVEREIDLARHDEQRSRD